MAKVAIITDSTTYLPKELSEGLNINIVPTVVIWDGKELRDGVDIQPGEFYERLAKAETMPTTSQPSPAAFKDMYEKLQKDGHTDILGLFVSAKLSGTIASANQAKDLVSGLNIEVMDGHSASMGTGWALLEAAKAAKAGKSLQECAAIAKTAGEHTGLLLLVDTLEFLHRGGRIGGGARFLGTALNLKPILEVQEGALEARERVRTKAKALARVLDLVEERIGGRTPLHLAVVHANAEADAKALLDEAKARFNPAMTALTAVSPSVGTHTGPGTLGVAFMAGYEG